MIMVVKQSASLNSLEGLIDLCKLEHVASGPGPPRFGVTLLKTPSNQQVASQKILTKVVKQFADGHHEVQKFVDVFQTPQQLPSSHDEECTDIAVVSHRPIGTGKWNKDQIRESMGRMHAAQDQLGTKPLLDVYVASKVGKVMMGEVAGWLKDALQRERKVKDLESIVECFNEVRLVDAQHIVALGGSQEAVSVWLKLKEIVRRLLALLAEQDEWVESSRQAFEQAHAFGVQACKDKIKNLVVALAPLFQPDVLENAFETLKNHLKHLSDVVGVYGSMSGKLLVRWGTQGPQQCDIH